MRINILYFAIIICINNFVMIDQQLRREVTAYWCGNGRRYKPKAS